MAITVSDILYASVLQNSQIIAGVQGLNRIVQKVGVCDYMEDINDNSAYSFNTIYITNLVQFKNDMGKLIEIVKMFAHVHASGILVMEDNRDIIKQDIIDYCNFHALPIIIFNRELLYTEIILSISYLILFDDRHKNNSVIFDSLQHENLPESEKESLIRKLNPNFGAYICVICADGNPVSSLTQRGFEHRYHNSRHIYVKYGMLHIFIMSGESIKTVSSLADAESVSIASELISPSIGISDIAERIHLGKLITDAASAASNSRIMGKSPVRYDPLSDINLLLRLRDDPVLREYYWYIRQIIDQFDSREKIKYFDCIYAYVKFGGDYKKTAAMLHVHENTVRYRINNIRQQLGMENDIIHFHEAISLFLSIHNLLKND